MAVVAIQISIIKTEIIYTKWRLPSVRELCQALDGLCHAKVKLYGKCGTPTVHQVVESEWPLGFYDHHENKKCSVLLNALTKEGAKEFANMFVPHVLITMYSSNESDFYANSKYAKLIKFKLS